MKVQIKKGDKILALFSKRHYTWLASVFRDINHDAKTWDSELSKEDYIEDVIEELCGAFKSDNPCFDRDKFFDNVYNPQNVKGDK